MNDIDAMPAGREMDALVAERVMGWVHFTWKGYSYFLPQNEIPGPDVQLMIYPGRPVPLYSTDIAAAWLVVDKMGLSLVRVDAARWLVGQYRESEYLDTEMGCIDGHFHYAGFAVSDTAPLAICRAALKLSNEV